MTEIYLIRHGQASFGRTDYDTLSELGIEQSRLLGVHWRGQSVSFARLYSGPLARQRQSCAAAYPSAAAGEPVVAEALREYDARSLFQTYLPILVARDPYLDVPGAALYSDRRRFQYALEGVLKAWLEDDAEHADMESWAAFCDRVGRFQSALLAGHGSRDRVAAFTSAGVIAVALGHALGLSSVKTIAVSWHIVNSSVTRLHYGRHGWSLAAFNTVSHLEREHRDGLITYR